MLIQILEASDYDHYIEYTAPRQMKIAKQKMDPISLMENKKIIIRSSCSLVSTGTELKVFRGEFEKGQATDLTIESLSNSEMSSQICYCMVGKIDEYYNSISMIDPRLKSLIGKSVFLFAPHGQYSASSLNDQLLFLKESAKKTLYLHHQ